MGYVIDGLALAACIGAYRVYTDRRKSIMHSNWKCYTHFWLNVFRHSGDFASSSVLGVLCAYPDVSRRCARYLKVSDPHLCGAQARFLCRAARNAFWTDCARLGYLQRVVKPDLLKDSMFWSPRSWQNDMVYSTPHLLTFVKDAETKEYLKTLCCVRDPFVGVLEGSPSEILSLVASMQAARKAMVQDIRKGHVLDRKAQGSIPLIHQLRLDLESFLFGVSGPDADRASCIELAMKEGPILERLFPYLEVIVDASGTSMNRDEEEIVALKSMAPNTPIFVPYLKISNTIAGINTGNEEYVLNPLNEELTVIEKGHFVEITVGSESILATVSGRWGAMLKVKVP